MDSLMELWALYSYDIIAVGCAFGLGYLVCYAQHCTGKQVMMPDRDEKGRFKPWKELA
jgi:hypothetical protein